MGTTQETEGTICKLGRGCKDIMQGGKIPRIKKKPPEIPDSNQVKQITK